MNDSQRDWLSVLVQDVYRVKLQYESAKSNYMDALTNLDQHSSLNAQFEAEAAEERILKAAYENRLPDMADVKLMRNILTFGQEHARLQKSEEALRSVYEEYGIRLKDAQSRLEDFIVGPDFDPDCAVPAKAA